METLDAFLPLVKVQCPCCGEDGLVEPAREISEACGRCEDEMRQDYEDTFGPRGGLWA